MNTRTVRIFISSTFRDMHAERDLLVREVFPELRRRCRPLNIDVVDVDLRWGVSEAEAEGNHALEVCLEEIRNSHPFFVGLLGQRYGWVPPGEEHSITALEIINGVLAPRDGAGNLLGSEEQERIRARSFFYFRDPESIAEVPAPYNRDVRSESAESAGKLEELKAEIRRHYKDQPGNIYDGYPCRYHGQRIAYDLLETELRDLLAGVAGDDHLVDRQELEQLTAAQQELVLRMGVAHMGQLSALAERVTEDLWGAITAEYGEAGTQDPLALEQELNRLFGRERRRLFVGRHAVCRQIREGVQGGQRMVVCGPSGVGKSSVLAVIAEGLRSTGENLVIERYVGASAQSHTVQDHRDMIRHQLVAEGVTKYPEKAAERSRVQADREFQDTLAAVAAKQPLVLILDGIDQLSEADRSIEWVQYGWQWPPGLTVVLGMAATAHDVQHRYPGWQVVEVPPLTTEEQADLVRHYLGTYGKELTAEQQRLLTAKDTSGSPLYLRVAAEELRLFARYEDLEKKIESLPADSESLFAQVLQRIETDTEAALASEALGAIAYGRGGITEQELLEYLSTRFQEPIAPARWARIHRQLRPYMKETGDDGVGMLDFLHRELRSAARRRCADGEAQQFALGVYYEGTAQRSNSARGYSEAVWQYMRGGAAGRTEAQRLLTDFGFWMSRLEHGQLEGLVADCRDLSDVLSAEEGAVSASFAPWEAFIQKYAHILRRGTPQWPAHKILLQLAVEHADESPITQQAEAWLAAGNGQWPWLRRLRRPEKRSRENTVAILDLHPSSVAGVLLHPDGLIVTWSDNRIFLWDTRGKLQRTLTDPLGYVESVTLLPTVGLITRSEASSLNHNTHEMSHAMCIWSVKGELLNVIGGYAEGIQAWPDGSFLSWDDGIFTVWNRRGEQIETLDTGDTITGARTLEPGHIVYTTRSTICCWKTGDAPQVLHTIHDPQLDFVDPVFLSDERVLTSTYAGGERRMQQIQDEVIRLWGAPGSEPVILSGRHGTEHPDGSIITWHDTALYQWTPAGDLVRTITTSQSIRSTLVMPDGRILSVHDNLSGVVTVRDADGTIVATNTRHGEQIRDLLPLDNQTLLSWTWQGNAVQIWRLEREVLHAVPGHSDRINGVLELPDTRFLTWARDNTLKIWDTDGALLATMEHSAWVNFAAYHPAGLIISCSDDMSIGVWNLDGTLKRFIGPDGSSGGVKSCQILQDGTILAFREPRIGYFEIPGSSEYLHYTVEGKKLPVNTFEEQDYSRKYQPSTTPMATQSGALVVNVDRPRAPVVSCRWKNTPLRWHGESIVTTAGISTGGLVVATQENGQLCLLEVVSHD